MRISKPLILATAGVLAGITAGALSLTAQADSTTACTVMSTGKKNTAGNADSRFVLNNDGTVSATFTVTGTDCNEAVTIASWQAPDNMKGQPYSEQKLFAHTTDTFTTGTHTISVALPGCFYQVDLIRGSNTTGPDGSAVYTKGSLMGSLHGGTQTCTPPTPPVLPKTGSGLGIFIASSVAAMIGYGVSLFRKTRA